jgi:thiamine-phosphate pyrophosphorylase
MALPIRIGRLRLPVLCFVVSTKDAPDGDIEKLVSAAVAGGVTMVQLREKDMPAGDLLSLARRLKVVTRGRALLVINDRIDVALAVEADGVHLAGQSLPVGPAARIAHGRLLVGRSVHGLTEAQAAVADGADYLTFGHVYPTQSHRGLPPHGLEELREVVAQVDVPVLAIGGVGVHNLEPVLATGCAGIAVISAILSAVDPRAAAAQLRQALDNSPHRPRIPFGDWINYAGHRQPAAV